MNFVHNFLRNTCVAWPAARRHEVVERAVDCRDDEEEGMQMLSGRGEGRIPSSLGDDGGKDQRRRL